MAKPPAKPHRYFKHDTWNVAMLHFLDSRTSPLTRVQYTAILRRFFHDPKKTPDKYTRQEVEAFLAQPVTLGPNAGQPLSPYTRNHYMCALKSFYQYCSRYLVPFRDRQAPLLRGVSPLAEVKLARTGDSDRDFDAESDADRFLSVIDRKTPYGKRDYALFLTLLCTGKRRAEIGNLRRGDVESVVFMENGRARQGWLYHYKAKWHVNRESAEMPAECMDAIRTFHEFAGRDFATMSPEQPLFPGITGPAKVDQPMNLNGVDRRFRQYARAAGIAENVVVHALRRENAWCRYQENGHDILDVRDALGHKNVAMTTRYIEKRKRRQRGDPVASRLAAKFARR